MIIRSVKISCINFDDDDTNFPSMLLQSIRRAFAGFPITWGCSLINIIFMEIIIMYRGVMKTFPSPGLLLSMLSSSTWSYCIGGDDDFLSTDPGHPHDDGYQLFMKEIKRKLLLWWWFNIKTMITIAITHMLIYRDELIHDPTWHSRVAVFCCLKWKISRFSKL